MKTITKEDLRRMLQYAGKYQISVQFWGEGNTNVYIEKDGVSLTDFGGLEPGEAVSKTVEYLDRINNVIGYATPQSEVMTLDVYDTLKKHLDKEGLTYECDEHENYIGDQDYGFSCVINAMEEYASHFKAKSDQLQTELEQVKAENARLRMALSSVKNYLSTKTVEGFEAYTIVEQALKL